MNIFVIKEFYFNKVHSIFDMYSFKERIDFYIFTDI